VNFFQSLKWDTFKHAHFWKVIQCDIPKGVPIVCFHLVDGCCVFMTTITKSFILELTARFPICHVMDVMGICYPQYRLQGDVRENFN